MRPVRRSAVIVAVTGAVLLGSAVAGWGQSYYEASGKTTVFTLTPGAKAGPAAIRGRAALLPGIGNGIRISTVNGGILITLSFQQHCLSDITVYNMAGRQTYRQRGFSGASLRFDTRRFAPGTYNVLVRANGQNYSRRFAVVR
jgi:hypothetical protein